MKPHRAAQNYRSCPDRLLNHSLYRGEKSAHIQPSGCPRNTRSHREALKLRNINSPTRNTFPLTATKYCAYPNLMAQDNKTTTLDHNLTPQSGIIPTETLYHYRKKGLSYADIGQLVGLTKQAVHQRLHKEGLADTSLSDFIATRADMFALVQRKILYSIDENVIKAAPLGARTLSIAQLYDKERLERGLATEHISVQGMVSRITTTLADYESRVNLLQDAMIERGISVTDLQDRSTIDTNLGISDNIDITNEP